MRVYGFVIACLLSASSAHGQRATLSLDGTWQIEESIGPEQQPSAWKHTVPVPGVVNLAAPPFPDAGRFDSREGFRNLVRFHGFPADKVPADTAGISHQQRNYFWYRTTFRALARRQVARLRIGKAQFGTAVWLNGTKIGEHAGCFTAGLFDATPAMRWNAENELVVRVGAHPGALPLSIPTGTDFEKTLWIPGIYDSVSVLFSDNPVIESIQVAPRIQSSEIVVQTRVRNYGPAGSFRLRHTVAGTGAAAAEPISLAAGEEKTVLQTLRISNAKLWSPEEPQLYTLETSTGGDSASTRFGMREFRFDTPTRRAYLNGRVYFLRGSNITLHRFFDDPAAGRLPWDRAWVRKLLSENPKKLHWNSFRFCIGPVPDFWLDIADEVGLLIQNEFFVWSYRPEWDTQEMAREYREWVRDNWNHPSVAIWDASNETRSAVLREIIGQVRGDDLSNRPWDNGYEDPQGPDDPVEDHPYLFGRNRIFQMTELERMTGAKGTNSPHPTGHAAFINEYGWLWLNRDGTPTLLTKEIYDKLLGPDAAPAERFKLNAYLLAGLTEFWRAHRNYAGVLHFVYLTGSYPGTYTSDHFIDLKNLKLEPHFEDYLGEAFKPVGVYINFWQPRLAPGVTQRFKVMLVNDEPAPVKGRLVVSIAKEDGAALAEQQTRFELAPLGQHTYALDVKVPAAEGKCVLKAAALADDGRAAHSPVSRRYVTISR